MMAGAGRCQCELRGGTPLSITAWEAAIQDILNIVLRTRFKCKCLALQDNIEQGFGHGLSALGPSSSQVHVTIVTVDESSVQRRIIEEADSRPGRRLDCELDLDLNYDDHAVGWDGKILIAVLTWH